MNEQNKSQWISFRVNPKEYQKIQSYFSKSAHRKLGEYARNILLQRPVLIKTRNESADRFLEEMLPLKKDLNGIGNNYNQALRKLHTLNNNDEVKSWLDRHEKLHLDFLSLANLIAQKLKEIHTSWSSS